MDRYSAWLECVDNAYELERIHSLMNKFAGPDDQGFVDVATVIGILLAEIQKTQPIARADAWINDKHYNDDTKGILKIQRLSGDLLSMEQCYINLAVVEQASSKVGLKIRETSHVSLSYRMKV